MVLANAPCMGKTLPGVVGRFAGYLDNRGFLIKSVWAQGPLPLRARSTPGAELYAFYMYLKPAIPLNGMYTFHSDISYVVDSFNRKTKQALCNGWAVHANLWIRIHELMDDIGKDLVSGIKVKAHTKLHDGMEQSKNFV